MNESELPNDKTPLILPRLVSRNPSQDNVGRSKPKPSNAKYMAPFIVVVGLERFTYYSIVVNLFLFLKDGVFHEDDDDDMKFGKGDHTSSVVSVMVLIGLSWLFCVLGGWASDAKMGKLRTIIWGLVIYAVGTGCLLVSAYCTENSLKHERTIYRALMVFGSILIALIGEGAVKANIAVFGAEQLAEKDPVSTRRYFHYYYFSINVGVLFALGITAYIQQWKGFVIGFAIPFASITLALIVFIVSRKRYKTPPCQRIVGKVLQVVKEARRNYKRHRRSNSAITIQDKLKWLDHARMKHGGSYLDWEVDEVKFLFAVFPVFILLLPYQTIYNQMNATFLQQGIHMKIPFSGNDNVVFPVASLMFFNSVTIVILLPIMEKLVYPWLTKRGYSMVPLTRISIGILVACFAIIAAGFVEIWVVKDFIRNDTVVNNINSQHSVHAANMSVFYQVPQYFLIGVSEVFASVGGLDFAYRNAPRSMQGVVMALFFATISFGSLLGSGLLELGEVSGLIYQKGKKDESGSYYDLTYYFFLLGALMLVSWIIFIIYVEHNRRKRAKAPRTRAFKGRRPISPDINSDVLVSTYG